jgi:hypothetical protein
VRWQGEDLVRVQSESELRPGLTVFGHCDCGKFHPVVLLSVLTDPCVSSGTTQRWKTAGGCRFDADPVCMACAIGSRGIYRLRPEETPGKQATEKRRDREAVR